MDCQKLHQEIGKLEDDYRTIKAQCEEAEQNGRGKIELNNALRDFDWDVDILLEKYLPMFQEKFGDKIGLNKPRIDGQIRELGDRVISTPWGGTFTITKEGLFSVVEDEEGRLSQGELILTGDYISGTFLPISDEGLMVFPASDDRLPVSTWGNINVIRKKDGKYIPCESINMNGVEVWNVVAISEHEWVVITHPEMGKYAAYRLSNNANEGLSLGDDISFSFVDGEDVEEISPEGLFALSDGEILVSDTLRTGVFAKSSSGKFRFVGMVFNEDDNNSIESVDRITKDRWLVCKSFAEQGEDHWCFMCRSDDPSRPYVLSESISRLIHMKPRYVSYLSENDLLIENDQGEVFIYVVQPDGGLEIKEKITNRREEQKHEARIHRALQLSDSVWLVSKELSGSWVNDWARNRGYFPGESYILQKRDGGMYELGQKLDGIDYLVNGAIPVSRSRYLLSDDGSSLSKNEVVPINCDLSILSLRRTFRNAKDIKDKIDSIIEVGNS